MTQSLSPDVTGAVERVSLSADDHAVIRRCVDRQPKLFMRGQHEGYYVHSDVSDLIDMVGRLSAALGEAEAALDNIASDDKPELGNRNTNDLLARMYWLWATEAVAKISARTALQQQEARDGRE